MADTGVFLHAGIDLDAVAAIAARVVAGTRILYVVDDDEVNFFEYQVAVDLHIKDYVSEDRELLMKTAVELRDLIESELGVKAETEEELFARERAEQAEVIDTKEWE